MKRFLLGSTLAVGLAFAGSTNAAVFSNGDFEAADAAAPAFDAPVLTDFSTWTELVRVVGWTEGANFGGAVIVPDSGDAGTSVANLPDVGSGVSQAFDTVNGATYTVSFLYSALGGTAAPAALAIDLDAKIDGATLLNVTDTQGVGGNAIGTAAAPTYGTATFNFTAGVTGSTTLEISSNIDSNPDDFGAVIDNVTVTLVPEPASMALMGLGGLLMLSRRRNA